MGVALWLLYFILPMNYNMKGEVELSFQLQYQMTYETNPCINAKTKDFKKIFLLCFNIQFVTTLLLLSYKK